MPKPLDIYFWTSYIYRIWLKKTKKSRFMLFLTLISIFYLKSKNSNVMIEVEELFCTRSVVDDRWTRSNYVEEESIDNVKDIKH